MPNPSDIGHSCPRVHGTFLSRVGATELDSAAVQTGDWKVARTRRQECLRYSDAGSGSTREVWFRGNLSPTLSSIRWRRGRRARVRPVMERIACWVWLEGTGRIILRWTAFVRADGANRPRYGSIT